MIIVGVDPGKFGAVSILNTYSFRSVEALSLRNNTYADIYTYLSEIRGGEPCRSQRVNYINSVKSLLAEKDLPYDNAMEMYLEEPGQIIPPAKGKTITQRLLAGMTASRKLGRTVGIWEGLAIALNIKVNLVKPKSWQKVLNCMTGGNKNISKNAAKNVFPFLTDSKGRCTITHDIADSLLIATYGYLEYMPDHKRPYTLKKQLRASQTLTKIPKVATKGTKNDSRITSTSNRKRTSTSSPSRPKRPTRSRGSP